MIYVYFLKYFAMFHTAITIMIDTSQKSRLIGSRTGATSQMTAVNGITPNVKKRFP
ncbi:hypothetical protein B0G71_1238 [Paraburkholderia sp. BL27I4N3]|nr:hypothetical protein B0G71_1238 [Paraburkholderia sp. BL27I4N3]